MKKSGLVCLILFFGSFVAFAQGIKLDVPGEYKLETSITETGTMIVIASSNVTLDLSGRTLSDGFVALEIEQDLSNISIKNGIIETCTVGISIKEGCSFIRLKNIEFVNCQQKAFQAIGTLNNEIYSLIMRRIRIDRCCSDDSAESILHFDYINDLNITDFLVLRNGSSKTNLRAISLTNSTSSFFERVRISNNVGNTFYGFYIESSDCLFSDCSVRSNSATNELKGFLFTGGSSTKGNLCTKCLAQNNQSINGPICGFAFASDVTENMLNKCISSGNVASAATATANSNGFCFDRAVDCSVVKCRALYNRAPGDGKSNKCAGFRIGSSIGGATGTKKCEFTGNVAIGNNGYDDESSYGFLAESDEDSGNEDNIFTCNVGMRNGPKKPKKSKQITCGKGGVPAGSVKSENSKGFNGKIGKRGNTRVT